LPEIISSGCDVILFSDDPAQDLVHLRAALTEGRLTWARVDDAVRCQLALKAALGLHRADVPRPARDRTTDQAYVTDVIARVPTLVKDVQGLLPLSPARHRRVLVISSGIVFPFTADPLPFALPDMLAAEGFEITFDSPDTVVSAKNFDLVLYLSGEETLLTRGRIFLDWLRLTGHFGRAMQRHWHDVPTLMISFGYPYLLYDAPRMPTYINAYSTSEAMQTAVVQALLGRRAFNRHNPVDPFCGLGDAKY
jgi:beta-N-acetylhexosaminidase